MIFKWSNEYSCNVKEIDEQHKKLFEIGEKLNNLVTTKEYYDKFEEINNIFKELVDYAIYHFSTEEKIMLESAYNDYEGHKKEHDMFVKKLSSINLKELKTNQDKIIIDLLAFVGKWIISHIFNVDMKAFL
jgi:hemerythrin